MEMLSEMESLGTSEIDFGVDEIEDEIQQFNTPDLVVEGKPDGLVQPSSSSSSRKCEDALAVLPCSHFVQVPHIKQLHSWDCGLACVLMALNAIGINNCNIQGLADLCCTSRLLQMIL